MTVSNEIFRQWLKHWLRKTQITGMRVSHRFLWRGWDWMGHKSRWSGNRRGTDDPSGGSDLGPGATRMEPQVVLGRWVSLWKQQDKSDPKGPHHARPRILPLDHSTHSKYTSTAFENVPSVLIKCIISICDLQLKMCRSFIHIIQTDSLWFTVTFYFSLCKSNMKLLGLVLFFRFL